MKAAFNRELTGDRQPRTLRSIVLLCGKTGGYAGEKAEREFRSVWIEEQTHIGKELSDPELQDKAPDS